MEHGFARVRCMTCRAEFLVALRSKGPQFSPSCHARRLAELSLWLDERLLAPVAHRQLVLTVPKRLRTYFVHDHRRLGRLSRLATHTLHGHVQVAEVRWEGDGGPDCRGSSEGPDSWLARSGPTVVESVSGTWKFS